RRAESEAVDDGAHLGMCVVDDGGSLGQGPPCLPGFGKLRLDLGATEIDQMSLPSFPDRAMQAIRSRVELRGRGIDLVRGNRLKCATRLHFCGDVHQSPPATLGVVFLAEEFRHGLFAGAEHEDSETSLSLQTPRTSSPHLLAAGQFVDRRKNLVPLPAV